MNALTNNSYNDYPELKSILDQMDPDTTKDFISSLERINNWESKIKKIDGRNAIVEINASKDNGPAGFLFSFSKKDDNWILDKKISITQTIDFIPLIHDEN